ncbi:MAG: Re/Si-specific NAD(P)(+) transhydrogenase subunit alpha [Rickettsiales bacterium]|nr:Re/Si-specific NAD(P)(+) transhydrogenase subunit alpha [Rickettsiales bacterium]
MKLLVLKETLANEKRVSLTPDVISKYKKLNFEIFVETKAGESCSISDGIYEQQGAKIISDINQVLPEIDVIISVERSEIDYTKVKKGAIFIALLNPYFSKNKLETVAKAGISAFSLELLPRTSRAQAMDVLSSQSNLAGYRAVIDAVYELSKAVPMMMTAAGTVTAAKFMILGAGVAGLQAIATAKRLGAVVCAFDVRAAAKEQVQSLGAKFIEVKSDEKVEGVYAKEMSDDYKKRQEQVLTDMIKNQDVVITTALIPGKKAPILVTEEMVKAMKPGSLIIDIAAVNGGNCALTKLEKTVEVNGVRIIGYENFPSRVASDASKLLAKNIFNFCELLINKESSTLNINLEDDLVKATLVSHQGNVTFGS